MPSLQDLPTELVQQILHYIAPEEVRLAVSLVSKRLHQVAQEELLWKYYCQTTFHYWSAQHQFRARVRAPVHKTEWKRLYKLRASRDVRIAKLVDGIVASRVCRLQKIKKVCLYGYDAKDMLLRQCRVSDDQVDDALARRFFSCTVLDSIHRSIAIEEWAKYQKHAARRLSPQAPTAELLNCGMRLERALGAFDMFMLHDQEGDLDEITELLDRATDQLRSAHPDIDTMTTRERAIALNSWLHEHNLTGLSGPSETYRYLRNCLIGRALRDERHPSLPIISAAIYSSMATRIGIEAYCCALPSHVHAIVLSPPGISLDGKPLSPEAPVPRDQQIMFLDPYNAGDSAHEVPIEDIHGFLSRWGIQRSAHPSVMAPTSTVAVVMRTAQNIRASFTSFRTNERPLSQLIPMIELNRGDWARNLQPALYSMIWASIMMVPILPDGDEARLDWQQDVRDLLTYFKEYFPEDSWLVEKYLYPMYQSFATPGRPELFPPRGVLAEINEINKNDSTPRPILSRQSLPEQVKVRYRVGQVFKHRRYDYHGIILGWHVEGYTDSFANGGSRSSLNANNGSSFHHPPPPYYRCMVATDGSDHHVIAEDNVEVMEYRGDLACLPPEIRDLMPMAGKFFKRWDGEKGVFISNLKEIYPDD